MSSFPERAATTPTSLAPAPAHDPDCAEMDRSAAYDVGTYGRLAAGDQEHRGAQDACDGRDMQVPCRVPDQGRSDRAFNPTLEATAPQNASPRNPNDTRNTVGGVDIETTTSDDGVGGDILPGDAGEPVATLSESSLGGEDIGSSVSLIVGVASSQDIDSVAQPGDGFPIGDGEGTQDPVARAPVPGPCNSSVMLHDLERAQVASMPSFPSTQVVGSARNQSNETASLFPTADGNAGNAGNNGNCPSVTKQEATLRDVVQYRRLHHPRLAELDYPDTIQGEQASILRDVFCFAAAVDGRTQARSNRVFSQYPGEILEEDAELVE